MSLLWSVLTSRLAGPAASALAAVLAGLLAAALVAHGAEKARAAALARHRDGWKAAAARWEDSARRLRAGFAESEALRAREGAIARTAAGDAAKACDVRVASARRSARAIETIVMKEVSRDANGCPARGLVPRERLRDALAPGG